MSYNPSASGGGIAKYANLAAILNISAPGEGDYAVALDTGMTYQLRNGSWKSAFNVFTDPTAGSGWVLSASYVFNNQVPAGVIDVSGCDKFRIEMHLTAAPGGTVLLTFDADTASNTLYAREYGGLTGTSATTPVSTAAAGFIGVQSVTQAFRVLEFSRITKQGIVTESLLSGTVMSFQYENYRYTGSQPMNTLYWNNASAYAATAVVNVYKWAPQSVPLQFPSWQLVTELNPSAAAVSTTIPWDGQTDKDVLVVVNSGTAGAAGNIYLSPNGDVATADYGSESLSGSAASAAAVQSSSLPGMIAGYCGDGRISYSEFYLATGQGNRKGIARFGNAALAAVVSSQWLNTASAVTSLLVHSNGVAVTGNIRVYKLANQALVTTNPNVCSMFAAYGDAATVVVNPGEIEINGAVLTLSKAVSVALASNLQSGLTEAAGTAYYLYAVRNGANLSFMFSTTAPLMDRYGNMVASFDQCDSARAWFHPSLGLNYRFLCTVYNDASSNLLPFDKARPGYWESAWTALSGTGAKTLAHAFGKVPMTMTLRGKVASADVASSTVQQGSGTYGVQLGGAYDSATAISCTLGTGGWVSNGTWSTAGYYKLVLWDC